MPLINSLSQNLDDIKAWRHDIHAHPELQYDVHRTAGLVADKLREFGCDEVVTGIGQTGVVGVIRGQKSQSGKVIGLRSDMDAADPGSPRHPGNHRARENARLRSRRSRHAARRGPASGRQP